MTPYDLANLEMVQNWSKPITDVLALRRQDAIRQQSIDEQMNRDMRAFYFDQDRQERGFENRAKELKAERDIREMDKKEIRETTRKSFEAINTSREQAAAELAKAEAELDKEVADNADKYARAMMPDYNPKNNEQRAAFQQLVMGATPQASMATRSKVAVLRAEVAQLDRASGYVWDEALKNGVDLGPLVKRKPISEAKGDGLDELPPDPTKDLKEPTTPVAQSQTKGALPWDVLERDVTRPVLNTVANAFKRNFGGTQIPQNAIYSTEENIARAQPLIPPGSNLEKFGVGMPTPYPNPLQLLQPTPQGPMPTRFGPDPMPPGVFGPPISPDMMQLPSGQVVPMREENLSNILYNRMTAPQPTTQTDPVVARGLEILRRIQAEKAAAEEEALRQQNRIWNEQILRDPALRNN